MRVSLIIAAVLFPVGLAAAFRTAGASVEGPVTGGTKGRVDCTWSPIGNCGYPTMTCLMEGGLCSAYPHPGYDYYDANKDGCSCAIEREEAAPARS